MASTHKHIRSSTANKRPTTAIADGQIALNTNSTSPGLFFKDSTGATIIKVGPVHIGATAPNATPPSGGSSGNSTGEVWLDTSLTPNGVKIWNGSAWVNVTPIGSTTVQGLLELATNAETQTGSDTARAVTPAGLQSKMSDSTSTTSATTIASSTAVKAAYDLAAAALPLSGGTVTGNLEIGTTGSLSFEGATANTFETTIAVVDPTADRTITLPDTTGTVVTTGDTGTVTSTMIADGTIVNGDISATAEIAVSKLADGAARQLLQTDAAGTGVEWASNIDIPGTLDVTSAATFDSTIGASAGSNTTPSITFTGDLNTGIYSPGADQVAISTGGSGRLFVDASGKILVNQSSQLSNATGQVVETNGNIVINSTTTGAGQAASLDFYHLVSTSTATRAGSKIDSFAEGSYTAGSATTSDSGLRFYTSENGTSLERLRITSAGLVGIGTSSPLQLLQLNSAAATNSTLAFSENGTLKWYNRYNASDGSFQIVDVVNTSTRLHITNTGNVGIGTTSAAALLHVSGTAAAGDVATRIQNASATDSAASATLEFVQGAGYSAGKIVSVRQGNYNSTAANQDSSLAFHTALDGVNNERARIDSSGRLLVGTSTASTIGSVAASIQSEVTTAAWTLASVRNTNNSLPAAISFAKSRGTTAGSVTTVQNGDGIGALYFYGANGSNLTNLAATIAAEVDGVVSGGGANDMPGRLVFSTTADGAATVTERLRIANDGFVSLGGDTDTGFSNPSANNLAITTGGSERLRVDSSGRLLSGLNTAGTNYYLAGSASTPQIQLTGTSDATASMVIHNQAGTGTSSGANAGRLHLVGGALGQATNTTNLVANDSIGQLVFSGIVDGTINIARNGASIQAQVENVPTTTSIPTSLTFSTTASSSVTASERMRIDSSGRVGIGTASPGYTLDVNGAASFSGSIRSTSTGTFTVLPAGVSGSWTGSGFALQSEGNTAPIGFLQGTSERLRIDSSGRLLVGTSTGEAFSGVLARFQIQGTDTSTARQSIFYVADDASGPNLTFAKARTTGKAALSADDALGTISFFGSDGVDNNQRGAEIGAYVDGAVSSNDLPGRLVFSTTADGASSPTERMRISSGGDILLGTTGIPQGTSIYGAGFESASNSRMVLKTATSVTTSGSLVAFYNPNGLVGTISVSGSATAYNTSSDYRLKENITPLTDATVRVQQLKPSRFNFIADPDTEVDGFIAHEVQEIVPEAITGIKDEVDEDGKPLYQGIDQSKLVPLLTAALQEAINEIESLKARLTAAGI